MEHFLLILLLVLWIYHLFFFRKLISRSNWEVLYRGEFVAYFFNKNEAYDYVGLQHKSNFDYEVKKAEL